MNITLKGLYLTQIVVTIFLAIGVLISQVKSHDYGEVICLTNIQTNEIMCYTSMSANQLKSK